MNTLLARQPILDRAKRVFGYELLYRSAAGSAAFDGTDGSAATAHVIVNSLLTLGLEKLVMGKRAFINFNREMLVEGFGKLLPRDSVVIEILETVKPDTEVVEACRRLKEAGYTLALDDYTPDLDRLLPWAAIVKVDVRDRGVVDPRKLIPSASVRGLKVLAEKVESHEEFQQARNLGYSHFQGYFFARPTLVSGKDVGATNLHYFNLLEAVQGPTLNYPRIESAIRQEVSFTYKLLRYINSAKFGWRGRIESIHQALRLLADDEVRRWAMLLLLYGMGQDRPAALVVLALVRARFCELLAVAAGSLQSSPKLFLIGMLSLLDAIMNQGLTEAVEHLPLDPEVKGTLLHTDGRNETMTRICELVKYYELGDWENVHAESQSLGIPQQRLPEMYAEAVQWAESVSGA